MRLRKTGVGHSGRFERKMRKIDQKPYKFPEKECFFCLKSDTAVFWTVMWLCGDCVKKYATRYGGVSILVKQNHIPLKKCVWCGKDKITHFQINVCVCLKCGRKIGKRFNHGVRDRDRRKGK